jgi:uncharacterized RDD family membrane protein YckC
MTNPYAPPTAIVQDVIDPAEPSVLAERGARLAAAILDSIIFAGMVYLPLLFAVTGGDEAGVVAMIGVVLTLIGFGVWAWFTIGYMKRNGQSIAKNMLSIKVVRSDGSPASLGRLIWLRNVVNWLISIIPLYGLIDSLFIFGESRQCLHDKIADTIVVRA